MDVKLGQCSALAAALALACVVTLGVAGTTDHDGSGPLTRAVLLIIGADGPTTGPEMKPVGLFDIYEDNLRWMLWILGIVTAALSGFLAVAASRRESNSLWYSIGVFASASALTEVSYIVAVAFLVVCGWLIMRNRGWKMTWA